MQYSGNILLWIMENHLRNLNKPNNWKFFRSSSELFLLIVQTIIIISRLLIFMQIDIFMNTNKEVDRSAKTFDISSAIPRGIHETRWWVLECRVKQNEFPLFLPEGKGHALLTCRVANCDSIARRIRENEERSLKNCLFPDFEEKRIMRRKMHCF